jgi:hypothetical protein
MILSSFAVVALPNLCAALHLLARVAPEQPRYGEFAKLVTYHVLGYEDRYVLPAIVNHEGVADEQRKDG